MQGEILDVGRERAGSRDDGVLASVFAGSYRRLVVQMYAVTGDYEEAEDVVQEAFVRASARRRGFEATDNPEAWLRTVAVNLYRSRWRKLRNFSRIRHRLAEPADLAGLDADHVALMGALRALPEAQRVAVVLHHLVDLSVEEVARLLECPTGTVKSRLARGRDGLSAALAAREVGFNA